jgi:four helix bundle protein
MTPQELQQRTLRFAVAVFRFVRPLMREPDSRHVAQQLFRAASSVAANYRAACLARSRAEWTAKIGLVREESDESLFWCVFLKEAEVIGASPELDRLHTEARELTRIFAASYRSSSLGHRRSQSRSVGSAEPK